VRLLLILPLVQVKPMRGQCGRHAPAVCAPPFEADVPVGWMYRNSIVSAVGGADVKAKRDVRRDTT
jgi:hypothetical protein